MKITTENFDDYLNVIYSLYNHECYSLAYNIGFELYKVAKNWTYDESDKVNISLLYRLLASSELNAAVRDEKYDFLAVALDHTDYWKPQLFEKGSYTWSFICSTKADAYAALGQKRAENDAVKDSYMELAEIYYDNVIEATPTGDVEAEDIDDLKMNAKIEKAFVGGQFDKIAARNYAISLFGENLSEENKERLMEIYMLLTHEVLERGTWKTELAINTTEDVPQEVKDYCKLFFLELGAKPGDDDLRWRLFTHKIAPEDRKKIRLVEKIEDAADNNFDEIAWVFTTDCYPEDVDWDGKEEIPAPGIYKIDESNPVLYHLVN